MWPASVRFASRPREAVAAGKSGAIALRPEKIRIAASMPRCRCGHADRTEPDNHFRGTVTDYLYLGEVTVYIVSTPQRLQARNTAREFGRGRTKFFEVGDAVEMSWHVDAGHFIAS